MQEGQPLQQHMWISLLVVLAVITFFNSIIDFDKGFDIQDSRASVIDMAWLHSEAVDMQHSPDKERVLAGYPPGLLYVYQIANTVLGIDNLVPPAQYRAFNFVLVILSFTNALLVILLAQLGAKLHSRLFGILIAAIWTLAPLITERVTVILTEPWQALFYTLAALWGLIALEKESPKYAVLSIIAGLAAIIFKYTAFSALGFGVGATVWLMKDNWRKWSVVFAIQVALMLACALWLFLGYGASDLLDRPEPAAFVNSGVFRIDVADLWAIILVALQQMGLPHQIFAVIFVLGSGLYLMDKTPRQRFFWLTLAVITLFYIAFILTYIVYWEGALRYTTSVSPLSVILMGLSIVAIGDWLVERIKLKRHTLRLVVPVLPIILWLLPLALTSASRFVERSRPFADKQLILWLRDAVPEGTLILRNVPQMYLVFNELNPYANAARPWVADSILDHTIEEWREIYVNYVDLDDRSIEQLRSTEEGGAVLENILALKHFPPAHDQNKWRGNPFTIYYLGQPHALSDEAFGEQIALYGYDFDLEDDQLTIRPFWQATQTPENNYQVFIHITPDDNREVIAQADGTPALPTYPTTAWQDPDEVIIGTSFTIRLPDDMDTDSYRVLLGLYDLNTGTRLLTQDGNDFVELAAP